MNIDFASPLNATILGNTLGQWAGLAIVLVLSVIASRVTVWRLNQSVKFFIKSEESKLDDLLVEAFDTPLFSMLILCGVWLGFNILSVSEELASLFLRTWQFLFTLAITWMVSRLYSVFHSVYVVDYFAKRHAQLDDQLLGTINSGVRTIIWVLGGLLALNNVGYDITAVIAGLAIAGLAVALAAQDTVSNLFGGVIIFAQQPFKTGETIDVNDIQGIVKTIGIRTTKILDDLGQEVLVPNRYFAQNPIRNISSRSSYVVKAVIPLDISTDPEQVEHFTSFLRTYIVKHPDLHDDCIVGVSGFDRNAINVEYRFEIRKFDEADTRFPDEASKLSAIRSEINMNILHEMKAMSVSFAEPLAV